ncbi:MAG: site-2 protease family protein [Anaerotignum sp.]|nr:site-2 protease family protein [Anaerotignum sp.]
MRNISSLLITIILLGILVVAHEFGHFIVAKKSGIWVQEFAVGMGPKVFSCMKDDTEYSLRVLPLGGFCRMEGETEDGSAPGPRSFLTKSVGVRFAVMVAGPLMNFLLAFVMIFGLTCTSYTATPEIRAVMPASAAEECGLRAGDTIRKINGKTIHIYDELSYMLMDNHGESIRLEVLGADGMMYQYELQPRLDEASGRYLIGFNPNVEAGIFAEPVEGYGEMSLAETAHYSLFSMINYVKMTAEGLVRVFTFTADQDEYGGPIAIFKTVETSYEAGLEYSLMAAIQNVVYIGAVLSANLGVLNLFPIPALDGGKILFLIIEGIRRKPMEAELEGRLQLAGFVFIMGLMVYVLFSDIMKFII